MNSSIPNVHTSAFYTVREAAWILGIAESEVSQAIRTGALPAVRRRSRMVVPAHVLARLLNKPDGISPPTAGRDNGGDA